MAEPRQMIDAYEVARILSVSVRTVWRMARRGQLPRPVRYSNKLSRWYADDIARCQKKAENA